MSNLSRQADDITGIASSYARKSDHNQLALEDQHALNRAEAAKHGFIIPDHLLFEDDETSGATTSREGLDAALGAVAQLGRDFAERIYVVDRERLGRFDDPGFQDWVRIEFVRRGVRMVFSRDSNPDYSQGMTAENQAAAVTDRVNAIGTSVERKKIRDRAQRGVGNRLKRGFFPAGFPPYGTVRWLAHVKTKALLCEVPDGVSMHVPEHGFLLRWRDGPDGPYREARRKMFEWVDSEDMSFIGIAKRLEDGGYPATSIQNAYRRRRKPKWQGEGETVGVPALFRPPKWNPSNVRHVMRHPINVGDLIWKRRRGQGLEDAATAAPDSPNPVIVRGVLEDPPISRELWERVQRRLDERAKAVTNRRNRGSVYLLTGRVFCPVCGIVFHGQMGNGVRRYRHPIHVYDGHGGRIPWECPTHGRYIRAEDVEAHVLTAVVNAVTTPEFRQAVEEELVRQTSDAQSARMQERAESIRADTARIQAAMEQAAIELSLATNPIVKETNRKVMNAHAETIERLMAEQAQINTTYSAAVIAQRELAGMLVNAERLIAAMQEATDLRRKTIVRHLVSRIELHCDTHQADIYLRFRIPNLSN